MRQEWEYLELVARYLPGGKATESKKVFGKKEPLVLVARYGAEDVAGLVPILTRAGEHGWELVTILIHDHRKVTAGGFDPLTVAALSGVIYSPPGAGEGPVLALVFKRPIERR